MALDEHLRHGRRTAEVAVDLEWRALVEEVGITLADEVFEQDFRVVAIVQARPEVGFPRHAPAGGAVAAALDAFARTGEKLRRGGRDFGTGIQRPEVRDVPVLRFGFREVLLPFQDASVRANTRGREAR